MIDHNLQGAAQKTKKKKPFSDRITGLTGSFKRLIFLYPVYPVNPV
jgi:hypothetical protein